MMGKKLLCLLLAFSLSYQVIHADAMLSRAEMERLVRTDKSAEITGTESALVTIDERRVIRAADKEMLGISSGTDADNGYFLASSSTELTAEAKKVIREFAPVSLLRFVISGSAINSIGPMDKRKPAVFDTVHRARKITREFGVNKFGPLEAVKLMRESNPNAKFVMCLDIDEDPGQLANFARFLMDEPSESEWGKLRAQYGVIEPVDVIFELGNERDGYDGWLFNEKQLEWYTQTARRVIDAIKAVRPDARFCACGKTAPWGDPVDGPKWDIGVAKAIGKDCQYWAQHLYYSGLEMPIINDYMDRAMKSLETALGPDHGIQILMTEHAKWPAAGAEGDGTDMVDLRTCLATANFFNSMYMRTDIAGANFHCLFSVNTKIWGMLKPDNGRYLKMGIVELFKVYDENLGERVVHSLVQGESERIDPSKNSAKFSALATAAGKRELSIFLCNRMADRTVDVDFTFHNKYTLVEEQVFTAPNVESWVLSKNTEDIFTTTKTQKNEANFSHYKMPNKSVVVLKLVSSTDMTGAEEEGDDAAGEEPLPEGEGGFGDIRYHWARNEILKMKGLGFVTGVSETEFAPERSVTRGEFAAILARMLRLDPDYPNTVFSDIASEAWYAGAVNAVYFEGLMAGDGAGRFKPGDAITLEEVITAANRVYKSTSPRVGQADFEGMRAQFKSTDGISDWALHEVLYAAQSGMLYRLYENGYLRTTEAATRAQTVSILYRLYNLIPEHRRS